MTDSNWQRVAANLGARLPAPLILIVALVIIQFSAGAARSIMTPDNSTGLALFRIALGSALLWLVIRPRVANLSRRQWQDIVLLGIVYALFTVSVYRALAHLPIGLVATIGFLGPLSVSLTGAKRLLDFVWPALGFAGIYMLAPTSPGAELSWEGVVSGLIYAVAWALYILASSRSGRSVAGLDAFVIAGSIAALMLVPFGYASIGEFVSTTELLFTAVLVTVTVTISFGLEFIALKRIEPRVFGVLLSLEPAIATLVGMLLLREFLSLNSWIAVAIVTIAAGGAALAKPNPK